MTAARSKYKRRRELSGEVPILRAGQLVSSFTGAFGQLVRETRITAALGYLASLDPIPFQKLFGFPGKVREVSVETRHEDGRSDVLFGTDTGKCVLEAKLNATDPLKQTNRYGAKYVALLCFRRIAPGRVSERIRYVHWEELAKLLRLQAKSRDATQRILSGDLVRYLEDKGVINKDKTVEVYAREINEETTLRLFLRARIYGCEYSAGSRLTEARYFAPHFGQRIENNYPGIRKGISYVAKVEELLTVETYRELCEGLVISLGKHWYNKIEHYVKPLRRDWNWPQHRSMLLLWEPRLVFNPPIHKESIQAGKGFLSKRFHSFDELFAAWKE